MCSGDFHQADILNFNVDGWLWLKVCCFFFFFLRENEKELPEWEGSSGNLRIDTFGFLN